MKIDYEEINKKYQGDSEAYRIDSNIKNIKYKDINIPYFKEAKRLETYVKDMKKAMERYIENSEFEIAELRKRLDKYEKRSTK